MMEKRITPIKAIRAKCLDCCCGSSNEVKLCSIEHCALWPYRTGHDPYRARREYTDEEREKMREQLMQIRRQTIKGKTENELGV